MASRDCIQWLVRGGLILIIVITTFPPSVLAAPEGARLILRPHCEQKDHTDDLEGAIGGGLDDLSNSFFVNIAGESESSNCPLFSIRDPLTRETAILKKDDLLDMDLVLIQDGTLPIHRVRAWLAYDPDILDGDLLETSTDLSEIAPGEKDFVPSEGYVKIDVSTSKTNGKQDKEFVVARIRMRVKQNTVPSTPISFYDVTETTEGHTMVISGEGTEARNILFPELGSLLVRLDAAPTGTDDAQPAPSPVIPETPPMPPIAQQLKPPPPLQPGSPPAPTGTQRPTVPKPSTPFTLLQVQNVGVTTEGVNIFLGWDPLSTPDLIGYNIYYASRSGEYIHKRSLDATSTSTTVRDLPIGVKYFFAIRGVNRAQQESAFSHEVAVTVGSPATSTAPLAASMIPKMPPALRTPLKTPLVPGQTGISSWITGAIVGIALIGTLFAIRKQLLLS